MEHAADLWAGGWECKGKALKPLFARTKSHRGIVLGNFKRNLEANKELVEHGGADNHKLSFFPRFVN